MGPPIHRNASHYWSVSPIFAPLKWARPGSNWGPPPCEGDVITTRPQARSPVGTAFCFICFATSVTDGFLLRFYLDFYFSSNDGHKSLELKNHVILKHKLIYAFIGQFSIHQEDIVPFHIIK